MSLNNEVLIVIAVVSAHVGQGAEFPGMLPRLLESQKWTLLDEY
jgi:hypothetical protein